METVNEDKENKMNPFCSLGYLRKALIHTKLKSKLISNDIYQRNYF